MGAKEGLPSTSPNPSSTEFLGDARDIFQFTRELVSQCRKDGNAGLANAGQCRGFGPDILYIFDSRSLLPVEVPLSHRSGYLLKTHGTGEDTRWGYEPTTALPDRLGEVIASTEFPPGTRVIMEEDGRRGTIEEQNGPIFLIRVDGVEELIKAKRDQFEALNKDTHHLDMQRLIKQQARGELDSGWIGQPEEGKKLAAKQEEEGEDLGMGGKLDEEAQNELDEEAQRELEEDVQGLGGQKQAEDQGGGFWKRVRRRKKATRKSKKKFRLRRTRRRRHYKRTEV